MNLVSDEILIDSGQESPTHEAIYETLQGFKLWDPDAWTNGHPFELYKRMREEAPVMWLPGEGGMSGFWSITRYEDIKQVELAHNVFSSQRGGINISVLDRKQWRPEKLVPAALNSLINLDEPLHLSLIHI